MTLRTKRTATLIAVVGVLISLVVPAPEAHADYTVVQGVLQSNDCCDSSGKIECRELTFSKVGEACTCKATGDQGNVC